MGLGGLIEPVETSREGRYKLHYINTTPLEPIVERWLDKRGRT